MGNSMGRGKRRAKVMKIDGSTVKVDPSAAAGDVLRDYPGFVVLDSDHVKQLGLRATPLDPHLPLKPGKLYFLVELPSLPAAAPPAPATRRIRSGINVSAKDRLESLALSRRSASDFSFAQAAPGDGGGAAVRVRVRLPRAQVARLLEESGDPAEAAEKIVELCVGAGAGVGADGGASAWEGSEAGMKGQPAPGGAVSGHVGGKKEKRARFSLMEDEIIR